MAYTLLMVAFFLFLPSLYTGYNLNCKYLHDWFVLLKSTPPVLLYSVKNYSLLSLYSWFFVARHEIYYIFDYDLIKKGLTPEVYYFWGVSCFVFFSAFFYDTFFVKNKAIKIAFLDYSCLFVCGLLFNPLAYLNSLVFLIVPYFFILRFLLFSEISKRSTFVILFLVSLSFIINMVDQGLFFKDVYQFYVFLQYKPLMWTVILVYLSLYRAKFRPMANGLFGNRTGFA